MNHDDPDLDQRDLDQRDRDERDRDHDRLTQRLRRHTIEQLITHGIDDAWLMEPGPGTVHVPVPSGSVFLSNLDGDLPAGAPGLRIGHCYFDDEFTDAETELWRDVDTVDVRAAADLLARIARHAHATGRTELV